MWNAFWQSVKNSIACSKNKGIEQNTYRNFLTYLFRAMSVYDSLCPPVKYFILRAFFRRKKNHKIQNQYSTKSVEVAQQVLSKKTHSKTTNTQHRIIIWHKYPSHGPKILLTRFLTSNLMSAAKNAFAISQQTRSVRAEPDTRDT